MITANYSDFAHGSDSSSLKITKQAFSDSKVSKYQMGQNRDIYTEGAYERH